MKPLTIALATYSDFDGALFSIQHAKFLPDFLPIDQFVLVNNNPLGPETKLLIEFCQKAGVIYGEEPINSTSRSRQKAIELAPTDIVIVIDSHVLISPGSLEAIREYFSQEENLKDLLHGTSLGEDLVPNGWSWLPYWRAEMFGIWNPEPVPKEIKEIWAAGLGLFAIDKRFWPNFHPLHRGFGGEEGYIHDKIRANGGRVIFHPGVKFWHRYFRATVPYPLSKSDKIRNYILHFRDLYKEDELFWAAIDRMKRHFVFRQPEKAPWGEELQAALTELEENMFDSIVENTLNELNETPVTIPPTTFPPDQITTAQPQQKGGCGGCAKRRVDDAKEFFERVKGLLEKYNDGTLSVFSFNPELIQILKQNHFHVTSTIKELEPNLLWSRGAKCPGWLKTAVFFFPIPVKSLIEPYRPCLESIERIILHPIYKETLFTATVYDPVKQEKREEKLPSTAQLLKDLIDEGWKVVDSINDLVVLEKSKISRLLWFYKGIKRAVLNFTGFVSSDLAKHRLSVCKQCPFYKRGRCQICGCFMRAKTSIESERCPLGKW